MGSRVAKIQQQAVAARIYSNADKNSQGFIYIVITLLNAFNLDCRIIYSFFLTLENYTKLPGRATLVAVAPLTSIYHLNI